jgi:hypothetical protein
VLASRAALSQTFRQGALRPTLSCTQTAFFSSEADQVAQPAAAAAEPTAAEIEANRSEWGIKYDDECLKFEKDWQALAE